MLVDPEQVGEFLHAGQDGDLFGDHGLDALPAEERFHPLLDGAPVLVEVVGDVALLAPEIVGDGSGLGAEADVEAVAEAVGGVGAEDDGAVAAAAAAALASSRSFRYCFRVAADTPDIVTN